MRPNLNALLCGCRLGDTGHYGAVSMFQDFEYLVLDKWMT